MKFPKVKNRPGFGGTSKELQSDFPRVQQGVQGEPPRHEASCAASWSPGDGESGDAPPGLTRRRGQAQYPGRLPGPAAQMAARGSTATHSARRSAASFRGGLGAGRVPDAAHRRGPCAHLQWLRRGHHSPVRQQEARSGTGAGEPIVSTIPESSAFGRPPRPRRHAAKQGIVPVAR